MKDTVTVAAIQMVSTPRVAENLVLAAEWIAHAAAQGAELVALPEYFPLIGAADADRLAACETFGHGVLQDWLAAQARQHRLWLVGGSIPLAASQPGKLRNSTLVFDPEGNCVARYDKIHLFAFSGVQERYQEADTIEAGDVLPAVVDTPLVRMGLSICYDLRFPELYRAMHQGGPSPELLVIPAAFTETTGKAHWEVLLRARAIENQCYVLAIGQGGTHENGRQTHGNSMLIDPWGEVLARQDKGAGVVLGQLSAIRLKAVRQALPALQHHHLEELSWPKA